MSAGFVTSLAVTADLSDWAAWSESVLPEGQRLVLLDEAAGRLRIACLQGARLEAVLFLARDPSLPSIEWLKSAFTQDEIAPSDRRALLAGRSLGGIDEGPTVCACFQVGRNRIAACIAAGAASTLEIGAACKAGTNCGSCVPEVKRMLAAQPLPIAAE
jgi:assimilatory nitrate reductase catalytic subunit